MLKQTISDLQQLLNTESSALTTSDAIESFRIKFLGRKGLISELFEQLPSVPKEEKGMIGKELNSLKQSAQAYLDQAMAKVTANQTVVKNDLSLPGSMIEMGRLHPVTRVMDEMLEIFRFLGFSVVAGPEIEHDWYNFSALNFEADHPARDMQDTYFISSDHLLRTHTTSVQARIMEGHQPPIRIVAPGKVYRNEAVSARSYCMFHQVDGVLVDKDISFVDLRTVLLAFCKQFFSKNTKIKLRSSFFPFTEPSAEVDITCHLCGGSGCRLCKYSGWMEILGCGMIDPNVLIACNIDPEKYSGYAFGMGVERITMNRFGVTDIRLLYENNLRFLKQF